MIWQLLQVRHLDGVPLILVGEMWKGLVEWAATNMGGSEPPLAGRDDLAIPICVETADEAIRVLREQHSEWKMATTT